MRQLAIVTLLSGFLWSNALFAAPKAVNKPLVTEMMIDVCARSSECMVVPYKHCCGKTKRAINRKYKKLYGTAKSWQSFEDAETCELMARCPDDSKVSKAVCVNKKCELKF